MWSPRFLCDLHAVFYFIFDNVRSYMVCRHCPATELSQRSSCVNTSRGLRNKSLIPEAVLNRVQAYAVHSRVGTRMIKFIYIIIVVVVHPKKNEEKMKQKVILK